uniref:Uncharacterized protein n=1 Tax=Lygus hesperus TaxID=30085 RepID=A0A0A9YUB4_LYGHE
MRRHNLQLFHSTRLRMSLARHSPAAECVGSSASAALADSDTHSTAASSAPSQRSIRVNQVSRVCGGNLTRISITRPVVDVDPQDPDQLPAPASAPVLAQQLSTPAPPPPSCAVDAVSLDAPHQLAPPAPVHASQQLSGPASVHAGDQLAGGR